MSVEYTTVAVERIDGVGRLTLDRPERANAINTVMLDELERVLDDLVADDAVRVVVLRGRGAGFSSGHDRKEPMVGLDEESGMVAAHAQMTRLLSHLERVWAFPKPTVAQVHGYCIGAATQLAACCDLTVVANDAQIGLASVPTGAGFLAPAWALLCGVKRAKQLAFDYGSRVDGRTAVSWGWANLAVPASELEDRTMELARRLTRVPAPMLLGQKVAINRVAEMAGFKAALAAGVEVDLLVRSTPEAERNRRTVAELGLKAARETFERQDERMRGDGTV